MLTHHTHTTWIHLMFVDSDIVSIIIALECSVYFGHWTQNCPDGFENRGLYCKPMFTKLWHYTHTHTQRFIFGYIPNSYCVMLFRCLYVFFKDRACLTLSRYLSHRNGESSQRNGKQFSLHSSFRVRIVNSIHRIGPCAS